MHPDGKTFEYEYDTADCLFRLYENVIATILVTLSYGAQRRRVTLTCSASGATAGYEYDAISRSRCRHTTWTAQGDAPRL
jgi:YD repeat-containing protein